MEVPPRASKRPRRTATDRPSSDAAESTSTSAVADEWIELLRTEKWNEAAKFLESSGVPSTRPSALALACRGGAPAELVQNLLIAHPYSLRNLLDSRGTPLHEAISCDTTSLETLRALLRTDELLDQFENPSSTRAALLQDVDGFTPLHLLIRRRFQSHVLNESTSSLPSMLEALVQSCPESVIVSDRGEYEEPPIVYALKANIYAPGADGDDHFVKVETHIYRLVETMLLHAPVAASQSFRGFRGAYTALHSAVFHGRHTKTIELLLETERAVGSHQQAALLTNTQSELPLHFWYVELSAVPMHLTRTVFRTALCEANDHVPWPFWPGMLLKPFSNETLPV